MILRRVVIACIVLALTLAGTAAHAQKPNEKLKESMGWLIGKKWEGKGEAQGEFSVDSFTTQERFRWICDKQCIEQRWVMKDGEGKVLLSGLLIYGWDPMEKKIKAWNFGSSGDVGEMVLQSSEGGKLVWKGKVVPLQEGVGGEFTYVQEHANGEYRIDFEGENLKSQQSFKAVPEAEFVFKNVTDSKPNDQIKDWGRFLAGGTWTKNTDDGRLEHPYRWILNKNFLYNPRAGSQFPGLAVLGHDPKTNKNTWWHFHDNGLIGKSTVSEQGNGEWKFAGAGNGPEGKYSWSSTLVREDGKLAEKDFKITIAGETQTEPDGVWVKEPFKKK